MHQRTQGTVGSQQHAHRSSTHERSKAAASAGPTHHETTVRRYKIISVGLHSVARGTVILADELRRSDTIRGTRAMLGEFLNATLVATESSPSCTLWTSAPATPRIHHRVSACREVMTWHSSCGAGCCVHICQHALRQLAPQIDPAVARAPFSISCRGGNSGAPGFWGGQRGSRGHQWKKCE